MANIVVRQRMEQYAPIVGDKDLITKEFLEARMAGALWDPAEVATTTALNGVYEPVGMTLTAAVNEALGDIDDVTVIVGARILVQSQSDKTENGLYDVTSIGSASDKWVLTRCADADDPAEFKPKKTIYVLPGGTVNGNTTFELVTSGAVTVGTTTLEFAAVKDTTKVQANSLQFTGDGASKNLNITHTLNTTKIQAVIYNVTTKAREWFGEVPVNKTTFQVSADPAIANGVVYDIVLHALPEE